MTKLKSIQRDTVGRIALEQLNTLDGMLENIVDLNVEETVLLYQARAQTLNVLAILATNYDSWDKTIAKPNQE